MDVEILIRGLVTGFLATLYTTVPETSMRNYLDALEGPSDDILATLTSALPRLAASQTLSIALLIAEKDMQPLIVTFVDGKFALLNLAKSIPNWIAIDAGTPAGSYN